MSVFGLGNILEMRKHIIYFWKLWWCYMAYLSLCSKCLLNNYMWIKCLEVKVYFLYLFWRWFFLLLILQLISDCEHFNSFHSSFSRKWFINKQMLLGILGGILNYFLNYLILNSIKMNKWSNIYKFTFILIISAHVLY